MAYNQETMIVGIDIGSGSLRAVGAIRDEKVKYPIIVGTYRKAVEGTDRGNIIDEKEVTQAIVDAITSLEKQSGKTTD